MPFAVYTGLYVSNETTCMQFERGRGDEQAKKKMIQQTIVLYEKKVEKKTPPVLEWRT